MKDVAVGDIRTFALLGHTGSGKTTLADALLFKLGVNDRLGSVANESSMADYTDEEKKHKISVHAKPFSGTFTDNGRKHGVVFCDTPGYLDFFGQVIIATRACDAALIVIDANAGIQVGTMRCWKQAESMHMPRGIVITGLDRENADYSKIVSSIQATWGATCVPVILPVAGNGAVVDIVSAGTNVPAELAEQAQTIMLKLTEIAAETDDKLIEEFLSGETLTPEEIANGIRKAILTGTLVPIFVCLPLKGTGISELLAAAARFLPSPVDRPMTDAEGKPIDPSPTAPCTGFVWRIVNDPFIGQMTFLRVSGGTLKTDLDITNINKDQKERLSSIIEINGRKQTPVESATAGEIVALPKLKITTLGDALCAGGIKIKYAPIAFPNPVTFAAVAGKSQGDDDKIGTALSRIAEEDPTLRVERNHDTRETILSGMGDVHLTIATERMKKRSNVEVVLSTPKVSYKETVTACGEGHYKHKKQSGGRGQYGEVYLRVEPRPESETEWFIDDVVGGTIPGNFLPAIQKGLVEGMNQGAVAGYPVINVKATVYDGSYHDVDSSEIAFKIAGSRAFRDGMSKARPVLLEPIMHLRIMVPDHFMGDVTGDLSHRRGRIVGMESSEGMQVIIAEAPQVELFRYCAELRSMTGGRGAFEMNFVRYDVVPSSVAQKIIAESVRHKHEEEE